MGISASLDLLQPGRGLADLCRQFIKSGAVVKIIDCDDHVALAQTAAVNEGIGHCDNLARHQGAQLYLSPRDDLSV